MVDARLLEDCLVNLAGWTLNAQKKCRIKRQTAGSDSGIQSCSFSKPKKCTKGLRRGAAGSTAQKNCRVITMLSILNLALRSFRMYPTIMPVPSVRRGSNLIRNH